MVTSSRFRAYAVIVVFLTVVSTAPAKYSGGTGEPNDPHQITTAAELIALGEDPNDYDKHFILTADIDLDPNLPGRKVFDKAVIAPDSRAPFSGVFDGNGHTISHLTITGGSFLALFGQLGKGAMIADLGLEAVEVNGTGSSVGGLVGMNCGRIAASYSTGAVKGAGSAGGLVGSNGKIVAVFGYGYVVEGRITDSYSTASVSGTQSVGGLVGWNWGSVATSYSTGAVSGTQSVGGLVGGGGGVKSSLWDIHTSGRSGSAGGVGLTTAEMMDPQMLGLNGFANDPNWVLDAGRDYPRLAWQGTPGGIIPEARVDWLAGQGTADSPYRIETADQLILIGGKAPILWDKHFILTADIDLDPALPGRRVFGQAVIPVFTGVFDGGGHVISHLTIQGGGNLGLFGYLPDGAEVRNIGVVDVNITSSASSVGGLVGQNRGSIATSYSTGSVNGTYDVGGLVGWNYPGSIVASSSRGSVSGTYSVGGLVGRNWGSIATSYSTGFANGTHDVGGLVGSNGTLVFTFYGSPLGVGTSITITDSYSTASVSGDGSVGGLVGMNLGSIAASYSTGPVRGTQSVGGLVGSNTDSDSGYGGTVTACFWDIQTSGWTMSDAGTGKTTAAMQTANTFLDAGWDFVGETTNGTEDIWWIDEGKDYPRLWWELPAAK